jgi:hypothetical protein
MTNTAAALLNAYETAASAEAAAKRQLAAAKPAWLAAHPEPAETEGSAIDAWDDALETFELGFGVDAAHSVTFDAEQALVAWSLDITEPAARRAGRTGLVAEVREGARRHWAIRNRLLEQAIKLARQGGLAA